MSNASRQIEKNSNQAPPVKPSLAPGLTAAHFTARELETLRKACRDSDFEHLWRDYVQPALNRAEPSK